jgi:hypothetical protein
MSFDSPIAHPKTNLGLNHGHGLRERAPSDRFPDGVSLQDMRFPFA